jgi:hypothetical protein
MRVGVVGCGIILLLAALAEARTWTDTTGKFRIEAELIAVSGERVTLRRDDTGKNVTLDIARLSAADQKFLRDHAAKNVGAVAQPVPKAKVSAIDAALARQVKLEAVELPLVEVLQFLGEQNDVNILFDVPHAAEAGISPDTLVTTTTQASLAKILDDVLRELDLRYVVQHEVIMVTTAEQAAVLQQLQVYRMLEPMPADEFIDGLVSTIEPTTWDSVGGPGSVRVLPGGAVLISQSQALQREIADQYVKLLRPLPAPAADGGRKISIAWVKTPLRDVVDDLAAKTEVRITFDRAALAEAGIAEDSLVTLQLRGVSLQAALSLVCEPLSLVWLREKGDILITTDSGATKRMVATPYDFRGLDPDPAAGELIEAITGLVSPASWNDVGGPGSIAVTQPGVLTVRQTDTVHRQLEALFAMLRAK